MYNIHSYWKITLFLPCHMIVAGYYSFMLAVYVSIHQSVVCPSVSLFQGDNLNKYQWIFIKLGMFSDIMEIPFGIANGQISLIFDRVICQ